MTVTSGKYLVRQRRNRYPLSQSRFFRLATKKKLATLLGVDLDRLVRLADDRPYNVFLHQDRPGKYREIQEPKGLLRRVHDRVHELLARIETPAYLHSGVKGRSYVTNARAHMGAGGTIKADIVRFFPSTTQRAVFKVFRDDFECPPDVAELLARILTIDGHLPTGSPISMLMAFFCHRRMFDRLDSICRNRGLVMTCYVDDIAITGDGAAGPLLNLLHSEISKSGLRAHKDKVFESGRPKLVTGVVLKGSETQLPFSRQKRISDAIAKIKPVGKSVDLDGMLRQVHGYLAQADQVEGGRSAQRFRAPLGNARRRARS